MKIIKITRLDSMIFNEPLHACVVYWIAASISTSVCFLFREFECQPIDHSIRMKFITNLCYTQAQIRFHSLVSAYDVVDHSITNSTIDFEMPSGSPSIYILYTYICRQNEQIKTDLMQMTASKHMKKKKEQQVRNGLICNGNVM